MNVVDSSAWLEFFADGPNAGFFAPPILDTKSLLVPSICLAEVFRRVRAQRDEPSALGAVAVMQQGRVIPMDASVAVLAGRLGVELRLPLADSIVLATARMHDAILWTQDTDFQGIPGVKFKPKKEIRASPR